MSSTFPAQSFPTQTFTTEQIAALAIESRVPQIIAGTLIPTILSSITVVARLYTRCFITRNWGNDDTLIALSWVTSIGLAVTNTLLVLFGGGHHSIFQKQDQMVPTLKIAFIGRLIYQFVLCLTKLGICVFYLRIFQDRKSKLIVYKIAAFTVITALVIEFVFIFQCNPVSDAWNFINPNCKPALPSTVANAACNIVADIWIMIFAIPRVLPLQMARRQKASLLAVVSLGCLVIAASIVRCYLVATLIARNVDLTWNGYDITTWTTIEVSTGLFCASAPCIRPLLRQVLPGFLSSITQTFSSKSRTRTYTANGSSKYGLGSVGRGRKIRGDEFELRSSAGEVESGGFWGREGDELRRGGDDREDGESGVGAVPVLPPIHITQGQQLKGDIFKTVMVKGKDGRAALQRVPDI